jgi:curved DNA-binding protein CbpA
MGSRELEQTYYEILEVTSGAGHHEIIAAYHRAKEAYAPDSPALYTMFTQEEACELRKLVEEAFLILGNQTKRKEYDQLLHSRNNSMTARDLPDFSPIIQPPAPVNHKNFQLHKTAGHMPANSISTNSIPDGFAKSRLSVYEVRQEIETEIKQQQIFDGPFLRKIRLYKNINLEQLSKETKISKSYIAALESDDYAALPAPVFLRGFVIQLARMLGLNEAQVANSYMARVKKD